MKNFLFVFPPNCYPISPYMSLPLLSSILKENGYASFCYDLNAKFYNEKLLNKDSLIERYDLLKNNFKLIKSNDFNFSDEEEQSYITKSLNFLQDFLQKENLIYELIENVENDVNVFKSENFYDLSKFKTALANVKKATNIFFYSFFQTQTINKKMGSSFPQIGYFVKNKRFNPYYEFYLDKIKSGIFDNYGYVMISQSYSTQNLGAWTLAYLLKKYTKVKVVIGGNYPGRLSATFKKNIKIFEEYFDYVLCGLGEESIVEFAEYANNRRNIENVSGIITKINDKIFYNQPKTFLSDVKKRPKISFDGISFDDYLIPEVVIPLQVSKGCPWSKCTFCVFHDGKTKYQIAPPAQIALEFKYLHDKYGITKFEFADESLSPQYYYQLANEILNLKLNISYYGFARFDDNFTPEILETMYKSGFKVFEWGYENPSERVMKIFNKGIDINKRIPVLKRANEAGIWNHCLTIINIPFETKEEILYDIDTYLKNSDVINSRLIAPFQLYKNAPMAKNPEKYNMTNIEDHGNLLISQHWNRKENKEILLDKDIIKKVCELENLYSKTVWRELMKSFDEYLFLYVAHHGKDKCIEGDF